MQTDVLTAFCTMLLLWTHCLSSCNQSQEAQQKLGLASVKLDPVPLYEFVLAHKTLEETDEENMPEDELPHRQAIKYQNQLKGLYSHLFEYPALMQRRLYVGSQRPPLPPSYFHSTKSRHDPDSDIISSPALPSPIDKRKRTIIRFSPNQKREFPLEIAESVCPARTEWRLLYWARDINNTLVEIFQPAQGRGDGQQWFYTVTCFNQVYKSRRTCDNCCLGINHVSFTSACLQKKSFVMALIRRPWEKTFDWNWIQVDSSCNCAIAPRIE